MSTYAHMSLRRARALGNSCKNIRLSNSRKTHTPEHLAQKHTPEQLAQNIRTEEHNSVRHLADSSVRGERKRKKEREREKEREKERERERAKATYAMWMSTWLLSSVFVTSLARQLAVVSTCEGPMRAPEHALRPLSRSRKPRNTGRHVHTSQIRTTA